MREEMGESWYGYVTIGNIQAVRDQLLKMLDGNRFIITVTANEFPVIARDTKEAYRIKQRAGMRGNRLIEWTILILGKDDGGYLSRW